MPECLNGSARPLHACVRAWGERHRAWFPFPRWAVSSVGGIVGSFRDCAVRVFAGLITHLPCETKLTLTDAVCAAAPGAGRARLRVCLRARVRFCFRSCSWAGLAQVRGSRATVFPSRICVRRVGGEQDVPCRAATRASRTRRLAARGGRSLVWALSFCVCCLPLAAAPDAVA